MASKNNFSCEASIGPVPTLSLHPALIGGWREAEEEAGGGLRGKLGERLGERLRQRGKRREGRGERQ